MKILFVADVPLENPTSGSEQVLHQQAMGLAREGMEVYAITRQAEPPSFIIRDVGSVEEGCYYASAKDIAFSFLRAVKCPAEFYSRFMQDTPFEAAVCHQPFNCFSLLITRNLQRLPLVYVFHSPSHEEYCLAHRNRSWLRSLFHVRTRRSIERVCIKKAIKTMVLSRYMQHKVQEVHGLPPDRTVVNPGGVDLSRFQPPQNRKTLKAKVGFPAGKVHLLTIRNLEPRMGIENLLKCVRILKKDHAAVHLILGGEGAESKSLGNMIEELGISDSVTMTGFIPPDLLPRYYGAADFFILPSRYLEGFGLVTPESMACGTPVLGTPVGGTKEILGHFCPEFLFRDTSAEAMAKGIQRAIGKYLTNGKQYGALRVRSREYAARNYSWQRHIDQLRSIICEVISYRNKSRK